MALKLKYKTKEEVPAELQTIYVERDGEFALDVDGVVRPNLPVGFSDHSQGTLACVGAVALGACFVEKHFTLDKNLPGPDHAFSSDAEELRALVGSANRKQDRLRVSRQALTDRSLSGFEETFWQGARARRWFRAFSANKHDELRLLGRRLIDLAVRFASSPESTDRSSFLEEGRQIGRQYWLSGARAGLTAVEGVEAFLYFRSPVERTQTITLGPAESRGLEFVLSARHFQPGAAP